MNPRGKKTSQLELDFTVKFVDAADWVSRARTFDFQMYMYKAEPNSAGLSTFSVSYSR